MLAATLLASQWFIRPATAEDAPLDDCVDCLGEVNGGLNACTLNSPSCVSTQNDDEVSNTITKASSASSCSSACVNCSYCLRHTLFLRGHMKAL